MLHVHPRWLRVLDPEGSGRWGAPPPGIALQTMEELWHVATPQPQVLSCLPRAPAPSSLPSDTLAHLTHVRACKRTCARVRHVAKPALHPHCLTRCTHSAHAQALPIRSDSTLTHFGSNMLCLWMRGCE